MEFFTEKKNQQTIEENDLNLTTKVRMGVHMKNHNVKLPKLES